MYQFRQLPIGRARGDQRRGRRRTAACGSAGVADDDDDVFVGEHDSLHPVAQAEFHEDAAGWLLTVASVTTSRSAISPFDSPRATSTSISRSRA
jgi:hypothetical protein